MQDFGLPTNNCLRDTLYQDPGLLVSSTVSC